MIYFGSISICSFMILLQTIQAIDQKPGNEYKVRFKGIDTKLMGTRKDIIDIEQLKLIKLGIREPYILNGTFTIYKNFPKGMKFSLFTKKRATGGSGFLRDPNLTFQDKDACAIFNKDTFLVPFVLEHSTISEKCPPKKGTYEIYNITLGPHNLPPNLQFGVYRTTFQWTFKDEPYVTIWYETEIERA